MQRCPYTGTANTLSSIFLKRSSRDSRRTRLEAGILTVTLQTETQKSFDENCLPLAKTEIFSEARQFEPADPDSKTDICQTI